MAPGGPIIDSNLLAQIQTLTNQLLSKTEAKSEPEGFNTVSTEFAQAWKILEFKGFLEKPLKIKSALKST